MTSFVFQTFHTPSFGDEEFDIPAINPNQQQQQQQSHSEQQQHYQPPMQVKCLLYVKWEVGEQKRTCTEPIEFVFFFVSYSKGAYSCIPNKIFNKTAQNGSKNAVGMWHFKQKRNLYGNVKQIFHFKAGKCLWRY